MKNVEKNGDEKFERNMSHTVKTVIVLVKNSVTLTFVYLFGRFYRHLYRHCRAFSLHQDSLYLGYRHVTLDSLVPAFPN